MNRWQSTLITHTVSQIHFIQSVRQTHQTPINKISSNAVNFMLHLTEFGALFISTKMPGQRCTRTRVCAQKHACGRLNQDERFVYVLQTIIHADKCSVAANPQPKLHRIVSIIIIIRREHRSRTLVTHSVYGEYHLSPVSVGKSQANLYASFTYSILFIFMYICK